MTEDQTSQPKFVPYSQTVRILWGDDDVAHSGRLNDWFYADNFKINCNIVGLPPGGGVLGTDTHRAIFGADELFYVLEGELVQSNPVTGEVHVIHPGQATYFRKDTWHHQWNYSATGLKMLEFFHPSPANGTGREYADRQPPLTVVKHGQDELLQRWPMDREKAEAGHTQWVIREEDILWRMEGRRGGRQVLVGIMLSTENVTIGKMRFLPGQRSEPFEHRGDKLVIAEHGTLFVEFPDQGNWFELGPRDGCTIPEGTRHYYYNITGEPTEAIFCVAPDYLPATDLEPRP